MQHVPKEASGYKEEQITGLVVLRSATVGNGARCVMTSGGLLMPKWPVDNWDSLVPVLLL